MPSSAGASAYWNEPRVVDAFAAAPPPAYLEAIVPTAPPGATALDVGCGGGRNLPLLERRGYRVLAMDIHEGMLEAAQRRTTGAAHLVRADVTRLPLAAGSVDVIVCHGVLHNLPTVEAVVAALCELRRVAEASAIVSLNLFSAGFVDPALRVVSGHRYVLPNGVPMTLLPLDDVVAACEQAGWRMTDGPHEYLREADPGTRSVWRAVLRPAWGDL